MRGGGGGEGRFRSGTLLYRKYESGIRELSVFFHRVNSIEDNIKQNTYTGMEVISLIFPRYCI